jgi:hypothetical protein
MHRSVRYLLAAGLLPLPWFLVWTTIGGLFLSDYSALSQHASELLAAGGAAAFCLKVAAIGSGLGFVGFGAGLWIVSNQYVACGAAAWMLFGLSMISNGLWPMGTPMHGLYAAGIVNLIAPPLAHLEVARWLPSRRYYAITAFVSICGVIHLWLNLTGNDPAAYRGLTQRIFGSIGSLWPFLISMALLWPSKRVDA